MGGQVRRPFWFALAVSLMLHLAALTVPGWGLPLPEDAPLATLDATLVSTAHAAPPSAAPVAMPKKPPRARTRAPAAPAPRASAFAEAGTSSEAQSPAAEPPPLPESVPVAAQAEPAEPAAAVPPAPTFPFATIWPRHGRIVFQVTRGEDGFIVGESEHRWQHDGATYTLRSVTATVGLAALFRPAQVVQESRGMFITPGLQPLEFRTERGGRPKDSARFDVARRRVHFGGGQSAVFGDTAQDLLSLFYQVGAYPLDVAEFVVTVATGRKVAAYRVAVGEAATLDTPLGARNVRHLKITSDQAGEAEDSTEIWLDTATRLPLKIRHRDRKGEVFDQVVMTVNTENPQ